MQASSFRLIVRRGPQPNQVYELNKGIVTLGRDITNDIVINDPEVSRHHCRLTQGGAGYTIEDLGSTNGTFVNGQRLTGPRLLTHNDMVGLGETVTLAYEGLVAGIDAGQAVTMPGPRRRKTLSSPRRGATQARRKNIARQPQDTPPPSRTSSPQRSRRWITSTTTRKSRIRRAPAAGSCLAAGVSWCCASLARSLAGSSWMARACGMICRSSQICSTCTSSRTRTAGGSWISR